MVKKSFDIVVLNSSPPWCTCLLTQHPFTQKQSRFSVVFKSKCVRYVLASHYFGCKTSFTGNLLFNLPQKVFACISGPPITLPLFPLGVKSYQDDYVFVFLYVFVFVSVFCILYFNSPISRFHCFHLVKPGQDDFDLVLL